MLPLDYGVRVQHVATGEVGEVAGWVNDPAGTAVTWITDGGEVRFSLAKELIAA